MPRKKPENGSKNKNSSKRLKAKEKLIDILELPKEIILNIPKITVLGGNNAIIENYKGVIEYDSSSVRINTSIGVIKITGNLLIINEITSEDLIVEGEIMSIEYLR